MNAKEYFRIIILMWGMLYAVEYYWTIPFTFLGISVILIVGIFAIWLGTD